MSVAPGDCNPTRAVCRFIAQSRARTGSFCGSVKGRPASLYVGWVSEAHPPGLTTYVGWVSKAHPPGLTTYVGWVSKAHPPAWQFYSTIAYPRSRGEHVEDVQRQYVDYGLSPLARGTLANHPAVIARNRFIPARAGNTPLLRPEWRARPVYPRSRGEHEHYRFTWSNPQRFIPARAGNTTEPKLLRDINSVYPRSRGEHPQNAQELTRFYGLSPLARGTQLLCWSPFKAKRFIPARAGNTSTTDDITHPPPVYPRSRGEHSELLNNPETGLGLSPLARGTLSLR